MTAGTHCNSTEDWSFVLHAVNVLSSLNFLCGYCMAGATACILLLLLETICLSSSSLKRCSTVVCTVASVIVVHRVSTKQTISMLQITVLTKA